MVGLDSYFGYTKPHQQPFTGTEIFQKTKIRNHSQPLKQTSTRDMQLQCRGAYPRIGAALAEKYLIEANVTQNPTISTMRGSHTDFWRIYLIVFVILIQK